MGWFDRAFERLLQAVTARLSDTQVVIAAIAVYLVGGLVVPIGLGWSTPWLVASNIVSTSIGISLLFTWMIPRLEARDRRHLLEWSSDLRRLDASEFEWLIGEVFRREGWKVEETGGRGVPDGGSDLIVSRGKERRVVQCKRWTSWLVDTADVRSFAGTLLRDGLPGSAGTLVTLSGFTPAAMDEAASSGVTLWDGRAVADRVDAVRRTEPCPICGRAMHLGRSQHGWWFRCVADGCVGKRDLGRDPARAVELLTSSPRLGASSDH